MSVKKSATPNSTIVSISSSEIGCCNNDLVTCKYQVPVTDVTKVTEFIIEVNGVNVPVEITGVTNNRDLRKAIAKALKENGYDPYFDDDYIGVSIYDGNLCIIGEAKAISITEDGTEKPFEVLCDVQRVCKYVAIINVDEDNPTGSAADIQSDLESDDFESVTVVEDTDYGNFNICIISANPPEIEGYEFDSCGCFPTWVASEK